MDVERAVLEEFGRCMTQIINSTQTGTFLLNIIRTTVIICITTLQLMKMGQYMFTKLKAFFFTLCLVIIILHTFFVVEKWIRAVRKGSSVMMGARASRELELASY